MGYLEDRSIAPIAETAAEWFVALRTGDISPEQRRHFAAWLAESSVHVREYLGIAETWGALQAGKSWPEASAEELITLAREAPPIVALPSGVAAPSGPGLSARYPLIERSRPRRLHRRLTIRAAAASLLLVAVASLFALGLLFGPGAQEYSTARGEQRSIVLDDGSIVQLNTLSRLIVRFDEHVRRIELPEGEALFRAAHDAARPFLVVTPAAAVRAIGTEFNVYSRTRDTEVAVLEGRVGVTAGTSFDRKDPLAAESAASIVLGARESILLDAQGRASRSEARGPDEAVSWTQRRLVFDDAPVARVVEEFNRYNAKQLQASDPRLATLRISGVFDADDPDALVKYLERVQGIEAPGSSPTISVDPRPGRAMP